jgi:transposase
MPDVNEDLRVADVLVTVDLAWTTSFPVWDAWPAPLGVDGVPGHGVVAMPTSAVERRSQRAKARGGRSGPAARAVGPLMPYMDQELRRLSRRKRGEADVALRARAVRMLATDPCVSAVADRLGLDRKTVRLWRDRFLRYGLKGLSDRHRSGRPRRISDVTRCEIMAMACSRPKAYGVECRNEWTFDALHATFVAKHPDVPISRTSVLRLLTNADLRPHRMQGWMHSQDPEFRAKATHICSLYLNPPAGSVVLCVDEKTGMQALKRKHATKWAGVGRAGRWEHEYKRMGTCTLFAAFNTQTGHVVAEISKKRKAVDLLRFMKALAKAYPTGEVHIVWDNLNIHCEGPEKRWTAFNRRHGGRFHFHYTPLHASWVNQVELFFSRVQRRVLRHASFDSVAHLGTDVLAYIDHWNRIERKPYRWTFRGYPLELAKSAA